MGAALRRGGLADGLRPVPSAGEPFCGDCQLTRPRSVENVAIGDGGAGAETITGQDEQTGSGIPAFFCDSGVSELLGIGARTLKRDNREV